MVCPSISVNTVGTTCNIFLSLIWQLKMNKYQSKWGVGVACNSFQLLSSSVAWVLFLLLSYKLYRTNVYLTSLLLLNFMRILRWCMSTRNLETKKYDWRNICNIKARTLEIWGTDLEEILIHCIRCVLCPFSTAGLTNVDSFNMTFREAVRAYHKTWQWEM